MRAVALRFLARTGWLRWFPSGRRLGAGCESAWHYYSDRVLTGPIAELCDPGYFPSAPGTTIVNLNLASPQWDSPLSLGRLTADRMGLPDVQGTKALRQAIAETEGQQGRERDAEREVLVTSGASAGYAAILDAFVNPGDKAVMFDPTSPMFSLGAKSRRANVRWVTSQAEAGELKYDPDELSRTMRGARLIVVSDPGNPTGAKLSPAQWEHLYWAAERSDVLVVVDDSFSRFTYNPAIRNPTNPARTLRLNSLTPTGLASARLGWVTGPEVLLRGVTMMAALNAPYVSGLSQQLALRELTTEPEVFGPQHEEMNARRKYTLERLTAMGFTVSGPDGGYFAWVNVRGLGTTGREFAQTAFRDAKVLVSPGDVYGPASQDFVRLSYAIEDGRLREGLTRLSQFVETRRGVAKPAKAEPEAITETREPAFSRA
ncbi:MAG: pyridoxal phosphate-dependent aminotransferase [Fimbriiglobus sp.]